MSQPRTCEFETLKEEHEMTSVWRRWSRRGQGQGGSTGFFLFTLLAVFPRLIKPQVAEEMSVSWKPKGKSEQIPFSLFKPCGKFRVSIFKKNIPQECV